MVKIALDAGHGLNTPGKQTPDGIKEWTLNDKVRDRVVEKLKDYDVSIINVDNDEGAVDETLAARVNKYINAGVSAFVSIHHNAYTGNWNGATGVEVWVDRNATEEDLKLANLVYNKLVKNTGLRGRGIKREDFAVINQNKIPAILCEGGFMDGSNDYKLITSAAGQDQYAEAVADGLIEYLNLKRKAVTNNANPAATKSVKILAAEVIAGKWGNGNARKEALTKAGYDYNAVQAEVDRQLKITAEPPKPANTNGVPFTVKVSISNLNIRKGPGTNYSTTGRYTGVGVFTITEVKSGAGSNAGWGKLKSGAGWISLDFAKKL